MNTQKIAPLLRCPFCGSNAQFAHDGDGGHWIECKHERCGASTNIRYSVKEDCKPLLTEQWNNRVRKKNINRPTTFDLCSLVMELEALRNSATKEELARTSTWIWGFLAACSQLKVIQKMEVNRLFQLVRNAEKYRKKELEAFESKARLRTPLPWQMTDAPGGHQ
ncbi:Lar family restriction alleviation protein [Pseudomonas marginalis]|jgi:hypothetical protein|uniref:Lar family restriction alleviation protein n=1 Tax=Pseudomonas marginalis TaxID=298 RepID=UPI002B1CC339|nr:Lar family restriction alleviation protein [Pseudomonas marginalis]